MAVRIKVKELINELECLDPETEVLFGPSFEEGAELTFCRTKMRGKKLVQIEFNELFEITEYHD